MVARGGITRALAGLAMLMALALVPDARAQAMTQQEANALLRSDERVWDGLLNAAIIAHIVRGCEQIEGPSRLARRTYFLPLYNRARRLGASRAQIEAFIDDEGEQARLEADVHRYIESTGARPDDAASLCALGRAEIAARTPVGRRLTER